MSLLTKTREQMKRIHVIIMTSMLLCLIVALIVLVNGILAGSWAVIGIGCWFLGFVAWVFYTY